MNRAVYVFTVVTVIYTPISFLAVGFPAFLYFRYMLTLALDILRSTVF